MSDPALSFEERLRAAEALIQLIGREGTPLDSVVKGYQDAMQLLDSCQATIAEAEAVIAGAVTPR